MHTFSTFIINLTLFFILALSESRMYKRPTIIYKYLSGAIHPSRRLLRLRICRLFARLRPACPPCPESCTATWSNPASARTRDNNLGSRTRGTRWSHPRSPVGGRNIRCATRVLDRTPAPRAPPIHRRCSRRTRRRLESPEPGAEATEAAAAVDAAAAAAGRNNCLAKGTRPRIKLPRQSCTRRSR